MDTFKEGQKIGTNLEFGCQEPVVWQEPEEEKEDAIFNFSVLFLMLFNW